MNENKFFLKSLKIDSGNYLTVDIDFGGIAITENENNTVKNCKTRTAAVKKGFFSDNIYNINAIVGKNGSGKTKTLNFIANNIATQTYFYYEKFESVWQNENGQKKDITSERNTVHNTFDNDFPEIIYFSNVCDLKKSNISSSNFKVDFLLPVLDYRLNTIINKKFKENKKVNSAESFGIIEKDIYEKAFNVMDDSDFVELMKTNIQCMPNALSIEIADLCEYDLSKIASTEELDIVKKFQTETVGINDKRYKKTCLEKNGLFVDEKKCCYEKAMQKLGIAFWLMLKILLKEKTHADYLEKVLANEDENKNSMTILRDYLQSIGDTSQDFNNIKDTIQFILDIFKSDSVYAVYSANKLACKFDSYKKDDNARKLFSLLTTVQNIANECMHNSSGDLVFFTANLSFAEVGNNKISFSSGELLYFRMYVSLYDAYKRMCRDSAIILIDEFDIYLHPELQRNAINDIVKFISVVFKNKKVQIIFTTNSPFTLTDLPGSNIAYLPSINKNETFGKNINSLLKDNFFMSSTMGEFAKSKIQKILDALQPEVSADKPIKFPDLESVKVKLNATSEKEIIQQIAVIGESIIRDKLLDMLDHSIIQGNESKDFIARNKRKIERLTTENERLNND